jgi:multimeric flavodoxin WrbA
VGFISSIFIKNVDKKMVIKKVLVVYGSPRMKKSSSYHLGEHFSIGLKKGGASIEEIMLKKQNIKPCLGCYKCWTKTPGKCAQNDDMENILAKISEANLVVYVTPLYIFSVPGPMKTFLDRLIPLAEPFFVTKNGNTSHPPRNKNNEGKVFVISAAGFPELSHFDAMVLMFKKFAGKDYIGDILIGGAEMMSKDYAQDNYTDLYNLVEQAGFELSNQGKISESVKNEIIEKSSFSPENIENFKLMGNKYWESLQPKEKEKDRERDISSSKLDKSDGNLSEYFVNMAEQYNPTFFPGKPIVIEFDFGDDDSYHLFIEKSKCTGFKGNHKNPNLKIKTTKEIWMKVSSGELNGQKAFMEGLYTTEGDMSLLMAIGKIFSKNSANSV